MESMAGLYDDLSVQSRNHLDPVRNTLFASRKHCSNHTTRKIDGWSAVKSTVAPSSFAVAGGVLALEEKYAQTA